MDAKENMPQSRGIPPPRIYYETQGRSLCDMTESESNARKTTGLPVLKHKFVGLPEPPAKRPTGSALVERQSLVDRVGQYPKPHSKTKSVSAAVRTNGTVFRNASSSSSSTSRTTRNTSGISSNSSTSMGTRVAPFADSHRAPNGAYQRLGEPTPLGTPMPTCLNEENPFSMQQSVPGKRMCKLKTASSDHIFCLPNDEHRCNDNQRDNACSWSSSIAKRRRQTCARSGFAHRDLSIVAGMEKLSLSSKSSIESIMAEPSIAPTTCLETQSYIPKPVASRHLSSHKRMRQSSSPVKRETIVFFPNKFSNTPVPAWDTRGRLEDMETMFCEVKDTMQETVSAKDALREDVQVKQNKINELELIRSQLSTENVNFRAVLEETKDKFNELKTTHADALRSQSLDLDDLRRKHRNDMEDLRDEHRREHDRVRREAQGEIDQLLKTHREELVELEKRLRTEVEYEQGRRLQEVQDLSFQWALQRRNEEANTGAKDREIQEVRSELHRTRAELEQEQNFQESLKEKMTAALITITNLEASMQAMKAKIIFLESDSQAQSQSFADLNQRMQEAINSASESNAKLRTEETLRRKLHNQVQELKGNIRVFCRVRPALAAEAEQTAKILFPDTDNGGESKELVVVGPEQKSALGNVTTTKNPFSFDRVFGPSCQNAEIFEEISQLVQSALDGYNVCIFCYGQTGSGKTFTMSSDDGMIPLTVHQIYNTAESLKEKGWSYKMEGSFVEVYNENLNDLLGNVEELDKKKLEIRHDSQKGKTTIVGVTTIALDSPLTVTSLLKRATENRSVAATNANERSSRGHSVFILKLVGENSITGEKSEGTLNLVDLAGSERIAHSGVAGDRLKETQNINRSLSCLGDVISALGQKKDGGHVPYRNSQLTYLLQHSLGGNSKTLMFVMISPIQKHLSETLTSLKFATKVHNTHIGTAKRQVKA